MKDLKHPNVMNLIGICIGGDSMPMIILPFMSNGDLLTYIRDEYNQPTVKELLTFSIQIANGMSYLSSQKFIHRDLAARNCMLDDDFTVKIADFGLAKDVYESEYYSSDNTKTRLPVKWMAPESLEKGIYNSKTDVWSYGVLIWELLTRGVTPYPDVQNWEILKYIKKGFRLLCPSHCPPQIYLLLLKCWSDDPKGRPSFDELADQIDQIMINLEKQNKQFKISLDIDYVDLRVETECYNDIDTIKKEIERQLKETNKLNFYMIS